MKFKKTHKIIIFILFVSVVLTVPTVLLASCEDNDKLLNSGKNNDSEGVEMSANMDNNKIIDNSSLMPKYAPDSEVQFISAGEGAAGEPYTPEWAKSLIMMEVHLETATPEGTFQSGVKVLDHCAEMGVNGIWLTPIYEKGAGGNGYGNIGLHTVEPALTGTSDRDEGWNIVKWYVDEAHKRNIRIFLDIITWGTVTASPLFSEHPDWYKGEAWGNEAFNWKNEEFVEWYISRAVENIIKTGADGYRADCEPGYAGYKVFEEIRRRLVDKGRKILIIGEDGCRHGEAFDFEQDGVLHYNKWDRGAQYANPKNFYIDHLNIVDSIKNGAGIGSSGLQSSSRSGTYSLYTYCVSNHDYVYSSVNGNRLALGYQAIFAPFIPLWYLGEEFNLQNINSVFYFVPVDWSLLDAAGNNKFYEDIKKYIHIRLTYPEIFTYFPENHKDSNICKADAGTRPLQAYARYAGNKGVIIVGNNGEPGSENFTITIPLDSMNLGAYAEFTLTDLMTGKQIASGTKSDVEMFNAEIEQSHIGVYLIEGR